MAATMNTSTLQSLMDQITESQKKANAANEKRYADLIQNLTNLSQQIVGEGGTFSQAQNLINTIGQAAQTQIQEQAAKAQGQSEQDLVSRGLGATSIRESAKRGIMSDKTKALQAQAESEAAQKANLLTQKAGFQLNLGSLLSNAMQNRTDQGPDLGLYSSLLQAAAAESTANQPTTVRLPASLPGGGAVTRWKAEQAAGNAAFAAKQAASASGGGGGGAGGTSGGTIVHGTADYGVPGGTPNLLARGSGGSGYGFVAAESGPGIQPSAGAITPTSQPATETSADVASKITGAPGTENITDMAKQMTQEAPGAVTQPGTNQQATESQWKEWRHMLDIGLGWAIPTWARQKLAGGNR